MTINETENEMFDHISKFRSYMDNTQRIIAFTVGVDTTAVFKYWQLMRSQGGIVDGEYPNNLLDVRNLYDGKSISIMK